jgi:hypothetical protein
MPDDDKKPVSGVKHTFFTATHCELCECLLIMRERVLVTAPPGERTDQAINNFRQGIALLISDHPLCDECEAEVAEDVLQGIYNENPDSR